MFSIDVMNLINTVCPGFFFYNFCTTDYIFPAFIHLCVQVLFLDKSLVEVPFHKMVQSRKWKNNFVLKGEKIFIEAGRVESIFCNNLKACAEVMRMTR